MRTQLKGKRKFEGSVCLTFPIIWAIVALDKRQEVRMQSLKNLFMHSTKAFFCNFSTTFPAIIVFILMQSFHPNQVNISTQHQSLNSKTTNSQNSTSKTNQERKEKRRNGSM